MRSLRFLSLLFGQHPLRAEILFQTPRKHLGLLDALRMKGISTSDVV